MSVVVGVAPGHCSHAAVHLAVLLARSYGQPLVVAAVNAAGWGAGRSLGVDGEYRRFVVDQARAALDEARALVPADIAAQYLVHDASSSRRGLLEVCEQHRAIRLVVGAKDEGPHGEIALGSVVTGLLQSAHVPVAIAPRGFEAGPGARLERITAAYSGSETSAELALASAAIAAESGCGIRLAAFFARPRALAAAAIGLDAEDAVIAEWSATIREQADEILDDIERLDPAPASIEMVVGAGADWGEALRAVDWKRAEALLVGSSSLGPIARVSLGSHAVKIVRHSPVPVVVVPRRATDDYIAQGRPASAG